MCDQATLRVDDIDIPTFADPDLRDDIPNEAKVDLSNADASFATRAGERDGHVGLGRVTKIDRAVVRLVRHGLDKAPLLRAIGLGDDHVHRQTGDLDLLAPERVEQGDLGDSGYLP